MSKEEEDDNKGNEFVEGDEGANPVEKRERHPRKASTRKKKPDAFHYIGYISDNTSVEEIERKFAHLAQIQEEQTDKNERLDDEALKKFYNTAVDGETHKEIMYMAEMDDIDTYVDTKDGDYDFNEEDSYDDDIDEYVDYPSIESGGGRRGKKLRKEGANLALLMSLFPYKSFTGRLLFRRVIDSSKTVSQLNEPFYDSVAEKLDPAQIRNIFAPPKTSVKQSEEFDDDFPETECVALGFDTNLEHLENWTEIDDMFEYDKHLPFVKPKRGRKKKRVPKEYHVVYISLPAGKYGDLNIIEELDIGENERFQSCYLYIWMNSTNFQECYTLLRKSGFRYVESVVWIKLDLDCGVKVSRSSNDEKMEERQDNCEQLYMFKKNPRSIPKGGELFRKHQRWVDGVYDYEFKGKPHYYPLRLIDDLHPVAMANKEVLWLWGDHKYSGSRITNRMDVLVEKDDVDEEEEDEDEN